MAKNNVNFTSLFYSMFRYDPINHRFHLRGGTDEIGEEVIESLLMVQPGVSIDEVRAVMKGILSEYAPNTACSRPPIMRRPAIQSTLKT